MASQIASNSGGRMHSQIKRVMKERIEISARNLDNFVGVMARFQHNLPGQWVRKTQRTYFVSPSDAYTGLSVWDDDNARMSAFCLSGLPDRQIMAVD
jgi:hypothetical protein